MSVPPPKGAGAPVKAAPKMEALLQEAYASFGATFGYAVDEVTVLVPRERIVEAARLAKGDDRLKCDYLRCLAVVEYPDKFQASYMLWSTSLGHKFMLKADAPKSDAAIPSVTSVWRGADWHEREGSELFGVTFTGHPNLKHLLLFDAFDGKFPMRKDFPYEEVQDWTPEVELRWLKEKEDAR